MNFRNVTMILMVGAVGAGLAACDGKKNGQSSSTAKTSVGESADAAADAAERSYAPIEHIQFYHDFAFTQTSGAIMILTKRTLDSTLLANRQFVGAVNECAAKIDSNRWAALYQKMADNAVATSERDKALNEVDVVSDYRFPAITCLVRVAVNLSYSFYLSAPPETGNSQQDPDDPDDWHRVLRESTQKGFDDAVAAALSDIDDEISSCEKYESNGGDRNLSNPIDNSCPKVPGILPHDADIGNALQAAGIVDSSGEFITKSTGGI